MLWFVVTAPLQLNIATCLYKYIGVGSNFDVGRPWVCQVGGATINLINLTLVSCHLLFWETDIIIT